jgi:hypothetical protein
LIDGTVHASDGSVSQLGVSAKFFTTQKMSTWETM